jgi:type VI secretion system protein ImpG
MDAELRRGFLSELEALDEVLADRHRGPRFVEREDPDVRRLMEALALFSARTRQAAVQTLRHAIRRLVHGHLDDFLLPQPIRGLVHAVPDARLTDPVRLPHGTRVRLQTHDGDVGLFTTSHDVTIRPLQLDWAERQLRGRDGFRILLRIRSRTLVHELPEPLSLYVTHMNDYPASLRLFTRLRRHLQRATVCYDTVPTLDEHGEPCEHWLGSRAGAPPSVDVDRRPELAGGSPVAAIRRFFHHPESALYLDVALPKAERPWRQAWLCLDLDREWPEDQVINPAMFRLFVVPIENLFVEPAEPIKADGTRSTFPLRSWQPELRAAFHSVVEVSQQTTQGHDVMLPGELASGRESYDVDREGEDGAPALRLRLPDAFTRPRVVSVRALWHQPWFEGVAVGKLRASLQTRHVEGVTLELQGELRPHEDGALWDEAGAMLQVMSRRAKRILSLQDITRLMAILGANDRGYHGKVAEDILHVAVREEPAAARGGGGVTYRYEVTVAEVDEDRQALLEDYVARLDQLVDAWSSTPARAEIVERRPAARGPGQGART